MVWDLPEYHIRGVVGIVFGASAEWGPGTGFAICVEGETLCEVSGDGRDRSRIEKGWDSGR